MKKFRRIFCFILIFAMTLSLVGCSSSKETDPKKVLEDAQTKTGELTSRDLTMNMDMEINVAGESLSVGVDMDCKSAGSGDTAQLAMTGSVDAMGMGIPMEMYYKDGCMYLNILEQKLKQEVPLEDAQNQIMASAQSFALPADAYKEISMEAAGSDQVISFTADGTKMPELVNTLLSTLQSQLGEDASYSIQDVTGTITVNSDGYITEETLHIPMSLNVSSTGDMSTELTCTMTNHNPGEDVAIDFPDFSEYVESDLSSFS